MITFRGLTRLEKYAKTLHKRAEAFEREVMKEITLTVLDSIQAVALPEDLSNYTAHLKDASIRMRGVGTAIIYTGAALTTADKVDPTKTLIYVRGVNKELEATLKIYDVLQSFQPFTVTTWPQNIKTRDFAVTYLMTGEAQVLAALKKNGHDMPAIKKALLPYGVAVDLKLFADPKTLEVLPDLAFQVLSHELRTKKQSRPHWTPAIKSVTKKSFLKKLASEEHIVRILCDASYSAFSQSGKMTVKINEKSAQSLNEFSKHIVGNLKPKD